MNVKKIIKNLLSPRYYFLFRFYKNQYINKKDYKKWVVSGEPSHPPHLYKQKTIQQYRKKYNIEILIETGTYLGFMVYAQKNYFKHIFSIELSSPLYQDAVVMFKNYSHIKILHGDSGVVLHTIVPDLKRKALFWLDGHYSMGFTAKGEKECPIYEELDAIFKNDIGHVILIDDARCFNGTGDYPSLEELTRYIQSKNKSYKIETIKDVIRVILN